MTEVTSAESEVVSRADSPIPEPQRSPVEDGDDICRTLARKIGMPEHAALIAALMEIFPEIYENNIGDAENPG